MAVTFNSALLNICGSGKAEAHGFLVRNAVVNSHASARSYIIVSERLVTRILGSGNVYYWDNPVIVTTQNGSGSVIKR